MKISTKTLQRLFYRFNILWSWLSGIRIELREWVSDTVARTRVVWISEVLG